MWLNKKKVRNLISNAIKEMAGNEELDTFFQEINKKKFIVTAIAGLSLSSLPGGIL